MNIDTPAYIFHIDRLKMDINKVREYCAGIPLVYSMKANPLVTEFLVDDVDHIEVCSPGELNICKRMEIPGNKIIYSGVLKRVEDIQDALLWNVDIITAESISQLESINGEAEKVQKKVKVLARLSSGNQFGMSDKDIYKIFETKSSFANIRLIGIHYYSGTQKRHLKSIEDDLKRIKEFDNNVKDEFGIELERIEYGPGSKVDYFDIDPARDDFADLEMVYRIICECGLDKKISLEFGRLLTAGCGEYKTKICDIKETDGIHYVITDGGTHHLRYYGQNMAMQIPCIRVESDYKDMPKRYHYCLCGSLCTVADVLVRDVELPELHVKDIVTFEKCGAYSSTEAPALFLSRELPEIYVVENGELIEKRKTIESADINYV